MEVFLKAIMIHITLPLTQDSFEKESIKEFQALCKTAQIELLDSLVVRSSRIFPATYMSKETALECYHKIAAFKEEKGEELDAVMVNTALSPTQLFGLEKIFQNIVIDRVELILRIFEKHAQTLEAKVQVEMAKLQYSLPRLKRMWKHLSRIEGGIGFSKGQGETQIEIDKRLVKHRIHLLQKKLKTVEKVWETQRKKRFEDNILKISLVGYTNAGKTSLMNQLAKEKLEAKDKLFATLSTVVRKVYLKENHFALVSDTVGFISQLPHFLVESFKATLKETQLSDVLLVVQDASSPFIEEQLAVVKDLLKDLGAENKPQLLVLTKSDLLSSQQKEKLKVYYPYALMVSQFSKESIQSLINRIIECYF
jgi:GTP-binding protein HflX